MTAARRQLARKRVVRILERHGIANARTLEQKISDAGPSGQRIDPHVLTPERNKLVEEGRITVIRQDDGTPWFHLADTPMTTVNRRLDEQLPIARRLNQRSSGQRRGQCLEIAIYRALLSQNFLEHLGGFLDLEDHDDSRLYSKDEPPRSLSGKHLPGQQRLDFLIQHPEAGWAGIEAKNVREWLYPNRGEITDLLGKAVALDCVPVLIARRIPFVTFKVLSPCGVVVHQNYNQLFPEADRELAEKAQDKNLLGYHDIRVGNQPNDRLVKFVETNLPRILPEARDKFEEYKDLMGEFAAGTMDYPEFAGRVRRRSEGEYEDGDWEPPDEDDGYWTD